MLPSPSWPGSSRPSTRLRFRPIRSFSGGVPAVLASARLHIEADCVRLEVTAAAHAPDSEVVGDRLKLLAAAIGVRRSEIVVTA